MSRARTLANFVGGTSTISGTPTFTGTVTGAGSNSGYRFISKTAISTSSAVQEFTNIFSADYNHYKLFWDISGSDSSDDDISHSFQFLKASDGSVDTTGDIDFAFHGRDSGNVSRVMPASRNNRTFFNWNYNTTENDKPAYYEMAIYAPFLSKFTTVNSTGTYMVNDNTDAATFYGGAIRTNTTSYSGMKLILVSSNDSSTPDTSCSATGSLLVYGLAES